MAIELRPPIDGLDAYRTFKAYQRDFEAAGIPWNQKCSPHKLRLAALWSLRKTPLHVIMSETMRARMPELARNITANNALLKRLVHGAN